MGQLVGVSIELPVYVFKVVSGITERGKAPLTRNVVMVRWTPAMKLVTALSLGDHCPLVQRATKRGSPRMAILKPFDGVGAYSSGISNASLRFLSGASVLVDSTVVVDCTPKAH